jgi:tRNA A-37 threonylcarbamoyl transferase component Bud32
MSSPASTRSDFLGLLKSGGDIPYLVVSRGRRPRWAFPTAHAEVFRSSMAVYTPGTVTGMAAWHGARLAAGAGFGSLLPGRRRSLHARLAGALAEVVSLDEVYLAVASSIDGHRCVMGIVDGVGRIRGFAKVALAADTAARARLRREAENLHRLAWRANALGVPTVLHLGPLEDYEVLVVSAIKGRPGLYPSKLTRRRADAAAEIFSIRGPTTTIGERLDVTANDPAWDSRIDAVRTITEAVADLPLPSGLVHGDFAAWNILEDRRRVVGIVDWEEAWFDGLPFWDLWHFCVMAAGPGRSRRALAAIRDAARGEGRLAAALSRYATACDVPAGLAPGMLLVYLARTGADAMEQVRAGVKEVRRGAVFRAGLLDELLEVLS